MLTCDCPSYYMKEDAPLGDFCPLHGHPEFVQWETKEGKRIYIKDMTTDHLKNAIALLSRLKVTEHDLYWPVLLNLKAELNHR